MKTWNQMSQEERNVAFSKFKLELAKQGFQISDKHSSQMDNSERHHERANLRRALNAIQDRLQDAKRAANEDEMLMMDICATFISDLSNKIDMQTAMQDRFGTSSRATASGWRDSVGRPVRVLSKGERVADAFPRSEGIAQVGFGEVIRMMAVGQGRLEVRNALSEGTNSAGGYTVPSYLLGELIDRLRSQSVAIQAGARTVMLDTQKVSIARLATDPTVSWRSENAAVGTGDPTFENVQFTARSLACLVKCSRELIEDSVNLEEALRNAFAQAMALEIDRVALLGSGTPPEPGGIFNTANVNSVSMGTDGAALTNWDKVLDALYEIELDNGGTVTALAMHPRTWRVIQGFKDTTNQPLLPPPGVAEIPMLRTTQIPINQTQGVATTCSSIIGGNFEELMIGVRSELSIQLLRELYAENGQFGFVAHLRADVQLAHPESFVKLIGIKP